MVVEFDAELFEAECRKQFGDEALADLGRQQKFGAPGTYIPSSSATLNRALGIGGLPRGRVVEIYGMESGGKTTLALDFCAHAQKLFPKLPVFYGDAENAVNPDHVKMMGVDTRKGHFYMAQSADVDELLNLTYKAAKAGASICVVDSVAALSSEAEMADEDTTKTIVAGISKQLRSHLRKMNPLLTQTQTTVLYINHITFKPGVMYGSPETTPGGKGLPFFASVRLDVRRDKILAYKSGEHAGDVYGIRTKVKVVKNKVAPPLRTAEFDIIFGEGIDRVGGLIEACLDSEIIGGKGKAWLTFGDMKWNGLDKMRAAVLADTKLEAAITAAFVKAAH